MHMTYRNVLVNGAVDGVKLSGENRYGEGTWVRFRARLDLLWIKEAMDVDAAAIMDLADGYGEPGFFPGGYDWSGIRDSTEPAIAAMYEVARRLLPMPALVARLGLRDGFDLDNPVSG